MTLALAALSLALVTSQTLALAPPDGFRHAAQLWGLNIGAAADYTYLTEDERYRQTLAREFDLLIPENEMKFDSIHPLPGVYDFEAADALVAFAETHNMRVRGHVLVWGRQLPVWVFMRQWTRRQAEDILRSHIQTVVGRYRGRVYAWDVINEAVDDNGSLRDSIWLQTIGPDYIDLAFRWAHEADPDAVLIYNDLGGEHLNPKADAVYELAKGMVERGVPVHGVGLEMHTGLEWAPKPADLKAVINRLAELGLEVHITEMDVRTGHVDWPLSIKQAEQAAIYRSVLSVCRDAPACKSLSLWGVSDAQSWVYYTFGGSYPEESPLVFDPDYRPKPAYFAMMDALAQGLPPQEARHGIFSPLMLKEWRQE
ncbi:MAG: endo-1,4-beta-xylanase [Caldilineales bacterium]|nr:endo-1,4-beta-xylanase [Caldilineales bacterium]